MVSVSFKTVPRLSTPLKKKYYASTLVHQRKHLPCGRDNGKLGMRSTIRPRPDVTGNCHGCHRRCNLFERLPRRCGTARPQPFSPHAYRATRLFPAVERGLFDGCPGGYGLDRGGLRRVYRSDCAFWPVGVLRRVPVCSFPSAVPVRVGGQSGLGHVALGSRFESVNKTRLKTPPETSEFLVCSCGPRQVEGGALKTAAALVQKTLAFQKNVCVRGRMNVDGGMDGVLLPPPDLAVLALWQGSQPRRGGSTGVPGLWARKVMLLR